ncbi:hypothetical protein [Saliniramus sp.]|uniref:hypothetical protein n=1 Tax=Saliniramus sp. TaxID=2986772 RepID=UPI002C40B343|nr:hypothetical protein [Saliniramus sp.]HMB11716.1 hypothetical protein [Saliniramus sp.]
MFKVLLKFWLGTAILYLIGHFVLTSHLRTAAGDAFAASNYGFVEVKRVSLPLDALVRMRVEGHATVIIDRREVEIGVRLDGNPLLSPTVEVQMGMSNFMHVRFRIGRV